MRLKRAALALSALLTFVFSLQLLSQSTSVLSPLIQDYLRIVVRGDASALGAGWLASYVLLNGSTVAATGVAFLETGLISVTEYFMMAAGSRLGAAFIVVMIGVLEYIRGNNTDVVDSVSIGILSFLVTYSIYLPATALGYFGLGFFETGFFTRGTDVANFSALSFFDPIINAVIGLTGPYVGFLSAFGLILVSLNKFDAAFSGLGKQQFRNNYVRFLLSRKWISLLAGALITLASFSVSLSLGLVVPLYNQGYIKREEIIPYIMGANITTLGDTLLAALVVGTFPGAEAVITLGLAATATTLVAMLFYDRYVYVLKKLFNRTQTDRKFLLGFAAALVIAPVLVMLI